MARPGPLHDPGSSACDGPRSRLARPHNHCVRDPGPLIRSGLPSSLGAAILLFPGRASNPYSPCYKPSVRYEAYEHYKATPVRIAQLRVSNQAMLETWPDGRRPPKPDRVKVHPYLPYPVTDLDAVNLDAIGDRATKMIVRL